MRSWPEDAPANTSGARSGGGMRRLSRKCAAQLRVRSSNVGKIASTVSTETPALAAMSCQVVAWMPWAPWSRRADATIRSRVGSTSRRG